MGRYKVDIKLLEFIGKKKKKYIYIYILKQVYSFIENHNLKIELIFIGQDTIREKKKLKI